MLENVRGCEPNGVINHLRNVLAKLDIPEGGLRSFTGLPVMTHGFFPGGNGLYEGFNATQFPVGGTIILGSNFGCLDKFVDSQGQLQILDERGNNTWRPLLKRLHGAGIKGEECFFTNAWPFLHEGNGNLGPVATWLGNQALMDLCKGFFGYTYAVMRPRLIIALGTGPAAFLSHVCPRELGTWRKYGMRHLDDLPMASIHFQNRAAICVAITHPSMPNARLRRPPYQYEAGEIGLLIEARLESERINK